MPLKSILSVGFLILIISGCSPQDPELSADAEEAYPYRVEKVDGVRFISNPESPWKGRVEYDAEELASIGVEAGEDGYMLNRPFDIKVDAEGRIFVMDWGDTNIRVYDPEGLHLRTIGRKGQGPGEFDTPCYFDIGPDGHLYLMDGRNQRVTVFTAEGEHVKDFRVKGFFSGMACDPDGGLFVQTQTTQKEIAVSDDLQEIPMLTGLHRIDAASGDSLHIGDFKGEKRMMRRTDSGGMMAVSSPFSITWNVSPSSKLVVGFNETYLLSVYSSTGELEFRFAREATPLPNPKVKADWAPKFWPPFSARRLVFDEEGNLWIELYTEEGFEGILYDVFTPEGIYLQQAVVPYRVYVFSHGNAYGLVMPEDGFPMAKRFRLEEKT